MARETPAILKHVGRGARLAKDLELDEAREMMLRIATGAADPVQIGGFLIAMRMKGESADELAGFTLALREGIAALPFSADVDVDLHGDGREGRPTIALAAACVAAACGVRVLLRGVFGSAFARNDVGEAFSTLGIRSFTPDAAARAMDASKIAVLDLPAYAPRVAELLDLREKLGVRTCLSSAVKLLDPAGTRRPLVGIFHSPYHAPVGGAAVRLGVVRAAIVQAPGGLPELAPDRRTRVTMVDGGTAREPVDVVHESAPLPDAPDAATLAALLEAILRDPERAPPGAVHATKALAALLLWLAGREEDAQPRVEQALADRSAARVLDSCRACYIPAP